MGWLDTPKGNKKQALQMFAHGNIKDVDRIHERERTRKINSLIWLLFVIGAVMGFFSFNAGFLEAVGQIF